VQLVVTDEGVNGLMLHFINETAEAIEAVVTLECLKDGKTSVMRGQREVSIAPRSTIAMPDVELWGAFFDTTYAYRFGPPSHDVTIATLASPAGEVLAQAFHFRWAAPRCRRPKLSPWRWRRTGGAGSCASAPHPSRNPCASRIPASGLRTTGSICRRDATNSSASGRARAHVPPHHAASSRRSSAPRRLRRAPMKTPSPLFSTSVDPAWIDYNGHMNDAYYALVFSRTGDRLLEAIGLETQGRERTSRTIYTTTLTIHYHHEVREGDVLAVDARLLEHDAKRLRIWFEMRNRDSTLVASSEQVYLCIDQSGEKPRAAAFLPEQQAAISAMAAAAAVLPWPKAAGRGIALKRT